MSDLRFSAASERRLMTCHEDIQRVIRKVFAHGFDCTVLCGHRTEEEQAEAVRTGHSKLAFPRSRHNSHPSQAIDVSPYPIDWKDRERFTLFAGFVLGVAREMGVRLRWGGDWNSDFQVADNTFDDLVHFEIVKGA